MAIVAIPAIVAIIRGTRGCGCGEKKLALREFRKRAPPRALHEGHRENRHREQNGDERLRVAGEIVVDHGVPSFH